MDRRPQRLTGRRHCRGASLAEICTCTQKISLWAKKRAASAVRTQFICDCLGGRAGFSTSGLRRHNFSVREHRDWCIRHCFVSASVSKNAGTIHRRPRNEQIFYSVQRKRTQITRYKLLKRSPSVLYKNIVDTKGRNTAGM